MPLRMTSEGINLKLLGITHTLEIARNDKTATSYAIKSFLSNFIGFHKTRRGDNDFGELWFSYFLQKEPFSLYLHLDYLTKWYLA
jgi:hypothetical protein